MPKEEIPLQHDMFSCELIDNRTTSQKKKDRERIAPQQLQMFSTPDIVQFGVRRNSVYKEWLEQVTIPMLELVIQDVRTAEEIDRDLIREAEERTIPLFSEEKSTLEKTDSSQLKPTTSEILYDSTIYTKRHGLRAYLRKQAARVRLRF